MAPWLWGTRVQILFVIDGRITLGNGHEEFGLGPVLQTLRDRSFAWWVRFDVDVVRRGPPKGFRFTQDGFDIDDFDQVWFFGDFPGEIANDPAVGDEVIGLSEYSPLDDSELRILAEWMERGGGVFATGDHSLLGASMCHRIPRVRTMRKWTRAQGVPSFKDEDRHDTRQRVPGGAWDWEGDRWPQPIFPVYQRDTRRPFVYVDFPHPLLCGEAGVIDRFPDHMHEGAVIEADDVLLDEPLGIPGFEGVEYPTRTVPLVFDGVRPRPEVIAHGLTTTREVARRRFGLIGVYDGDPVKHGRVVVDSTWHHWFSMNLVGFRLEAPGVYRGMQNYYRNVGLWLSTPKQRASMLLAATWGVLVGKQPELFSRVMDIWDIGERVVDVIGRTAPQGIVTELVAPFMNTDTRGEAATRRQGARTALLRPPIAMVNQAIVGSIANQLMDLAHDHVLERARDAAARSTRTPSGVGPSPAPLKASANSSPRWRRAPRNSRLCATKWQAYLIEPASVTFQSTARQAIPRSQTEPRTRPLAATCLSNTRRTPRGVPMDDPSVDQNRQRAAACANPVARRNDSWRQRLAIGRQACQRAADRSTFVPQACQ